MFSLATRAKLRCETQRCASSEKISIRKFSVQVKKVLTRHVLDKSAQLFNDVLGCDVSVNGDNARGYRNQQIYRDNDRLFLGREKDAIELVVPGGDPIVRQRTPALTNGSSG